MDGMHDLGGKQGFGLVRYRPFAPAFHAAWERRISALTQWLSVAASSIWTEGVAEHDAADQIEDNVRAFATGRRTHLRGQVLRTDDLLLRDGIDRRIRERRVPVRTNHAGAKALGNLGAALPTPPPAPINSTLSPAFRPAASMPHQAAM